MDTFANGPLVFPLRDEGYGPPVVLLHGFPQDARCWDAVVTLLHACGLRTLRFDQRGYAATARPAGTSDYAIGHLVGDVVALLDSAGIDRAHVVGHDLGGLVAWAMAGLRPERVRSLTVLSTPHPAAYRRSLFSSRQLLQSWYMAGFQPPGVAERILGRDDLVRKFLRTSRPPDTVMHNAVELLADPDRRRAMLAWYRALPRSVGGAATAPCTVPTTYLWSTGDIALNRRGAELTGRYVRAPYRFEALKGVSHWIPEEAPDAVAAAVHDRVAAS